jgi:plastocyanin
MRVTTSAAALGLCLAAACGSYNPTGPGAPASDPPPAEPNDVAIVRGASALTTTAFDPNPQALSLGGAGSVSVRWVNADGTAHQIASDGGAFATSATLGSGATYSVALGAGTYRYHCAIHPNMVGTITVGP